MAEQGFDLQVDRRGYVGVIIGRVRGEEIHVMHPMLASVHGELLRIIEMISSCGDRVQSRLPDGAVVGVNLVPLPGIESQDDLRLELANDLHQLSAKRNGDFNLPVGMAKKCDTFYTQHMCSRQLLLFPSSD